MVWFKQSDGQWLCTLHGGINLFNFPLLFCPYLVRAYRLVVAFSLKNDKALSRIRESRLLLVRNAYLEYSFIDSTISVFLYYICAICLNLALLSLHCGHVLLCSEIYICKQRSGWLVSINGKCFNYAIINTRPDIKYTLCLCNV